MEMMFDSNYAEPERILKSEVNVLPDYLNVEDGNQDQFIEVSYGYIPIATEPVWLEPLMPLTELPENFFDSSYTDL